MLDLTQAWLAKSDRLNADDLIGVTPTVTIERVEMPNGADPILHLVEYPGRAYDPSKGMGVIMKAVWGTDGEAWVGRRLTLFHKPDVVYAGKRSGGIRICAMSHMDAARTFEVQEQKGKPRVQYRIEPLPDSAPSHEVQPDWQALIVEAGDDVAALRAMWSDAQARGASEAILNDIKTAATTAQSKEN